MPNPSEKSIQRFCPGVKLGELGALAFASMCEDTEGEYVYYSDYKKMHDRLAHGGEPDISPGDVISAEPDGTIVLDDGITTWNPSRATEFLVAQAIKQRDKEVQTALLSSEITESIWAKDKESGWKLVWKGASYAERVQSVLKAALDCLFEEPPSLMSSETQLEEE